MQSVYGVHCFKTYCLKPPFTWSDFFVVLLKLSVKEFKETTIPVMYFPALKVVHEECFTIHLQSRMLVIQQNLVYCSRRKELELSFSEKSTNA